MRPIARGLTDRDLTDLSELERRVLAVDGGRLKLEWGMLRDRVGGRGEDFLWHESGRLLGFAGLYGFGGDTVEITGLVDPRARRRGIATALLDAALAAASAQGYKRALLVVPRNSEAGRELARGRGADLEHSEHALALLEPSLPRPADPRIAVRRGVAGDVDGVSALLTAAFGEPPTHVAALMNGSTLVAELGGELVGTLRVDRDADKAAIYAFAVEPACQGRGIGRDVLSRVCRRLWSEGVTRIGLEVAVENDRALGLYVSLGFSPIATEDYYELRLVPAL
jgi:ribosomal protein S18 acetylase RimI-like enzyme